MIDTLKTVGVGAGGFGVQFMSMLPEMVKVAVGIVTAAYMVLKKSCFEDDDNDKDEYSDIDRVLFYCLMDDEDGVSISAGEVISYTREMFIDWDQDGNLTKWKVNGEDLNEKHYMLKQHETV